MLDMFTTYVRNLVVQLKSDEEGLALTEYVLLLGLLTGAVIASVIAFGGALDTLWSAWATWLGSAAVDAPVYVAPTTP